LGDSPTKRYGSKIEGACYYHLPLPDVPIPQFVMIIRGGDVWVITHPYWEEMNFSIRAELYLRPKEINKLKNKYHRKFKLK
jgi:hypothetical protein